MDETRQGRRLNNPRRVTLVQWQLPTGQLPPEKAEGQEGRSGSHYTSMATVQYHRPSENHMRPSQAVVARGEHASSAAVAAALPPPAGVVVAAAVLAQPGRLAEITHCVDGGGRQ